MSSLTGSTKPELVLLCCMATWMSIHMSPIRWPTACEVQQILKNLDHRSSQLLQDYRKTEPGMPTSQAIVNQKYQLPCFTPGPQASHNISVIQAYLRETNETDAEVLEQLDKLKYEDTPETLVTAPTYSTDAFAMKSFVLAVLQQFSDCMAETHEAFKKSLEAKQCQLMKLEIQ